MTSGDERTAQSWAKEAPMSASERLIEQHAEALMDPDAKGDEREWEAGG